MGRETLIDTLVVGAGQAAIAMSEHRPEMPCHISPWSATRLAERWRSGRWDLLVADGPVWHDRSPGHISIPMAFRARTVSLRIWRLMHGNARLPSEPACMFTSFAAMRAGRNSASRRQTVFSRQIVGSWLQGLSSGDSAGRAEGRRADADSFGGLPHSLEAAGGRRIGRRCALIRRSDCRRAERVRPTCTYRSTLMTGRRVPIETAIIAGGWACSGNGIRLPPLPAGSM